MLSVIDVRATFESKLWSDAGQDLGVCLISGGCSPVVAQTAPIDDFDTGLLLPCNVVVTRTPHNDTTVIRTIGAQIMGSSATSRSSPKLLPRPLSASLQP